MAGVLPNLVDWAKMVDPDNEITDLANYLAQTNAILKDVIWHEGNLPTGHRVSAVVGLPQGTWRTANAGIAASKPLFAQVEFGIGELVAYSQVDRSIAELNGNIAKFRWYQDQTHVQGMGQQVASAFFYSNEATTISQFTGFSPYYNTVSTANAQSAANVIDAGGTGSSNSSIWLCCWGDETYGIFPKGSQAGLVYEDKGDVTPLYDASNNRFEGYTSYFCWKLGLAVANWQYNVRIANIDSTTAGLAGTAPPDLFALMSLAVMRPPVMTRRSSGITETDAPGDPNPNVNPTWYVNRTVREFMDIQAIRDKNVLLTPKEYAGEPVEDFRGAFIRVVDQLTKTEARVV